MKSEDVPDELLQIYGRSYDGNTPERAHRKAAAAMLAAHEQMVRAEVAADIETAQLWLDPTFQDRDYAARIARGEA